jgi:alpha-L-rhamnosidase
MIRLFTLLFASLIAITTQSQSPSRTVGLQCEYLVNPMGVDLPSPRLAWRIDDKRMGAKQSAYEICVGIDSVQVATRAGSAWQTGKINSDAQLVWYAGKLLEPFKRYFWAVKTWDHAGNSSGWSSVAYFETGLMSSSNWRGAWISDTRDIHLKPAPYFRKGFAISKKIKTARAYIAVGGLYELSINGQRVGDHRLDPMYTRFDRRTMYVTHDVTAELKQGNNAIGVLLGNGWYNHQSTAVWYFHEAPWRARPAFCLDLRITYEDNSVETISSGKDWKTSLSPIIFNSIYTAEHYDARLEQNGWNEAGFDDANWKEPVLRSAPSNNIVSQLMHPVRHVESIEAKSVNRISDTVYVFDLGRNIAGVSKLTVKGKRGTTVRLKHAERIYPNGRADQSNIDVHYRPTDNTDPFQTDIFILKGEGEEMFMPRFNYKGFQYIEVTSDQPVQLSKESLVAYFMHSDVPAAGQLASSNATLNKIWSATNNAYLSNLFGYPTDCPQREKNGWTGDAHIASETGLYNYDAITVYEKWMNDHRDEQQSNGVLPSIIPTGGWGYEWGNGPDWTSTIAIIPWNLYLFYGDTTALAICYENIKRYVDHIDALYPSGLTSWGLGDWIPVKSKSPVEFTSTAYYFTDASILARAAKLLGKNADAEKYTALAQKTRNAFNNKYLNTTSGIYGNGLQTELSVPLQWGLVPDPLRSLVAANLAKRVQADSNHLDVGLLGTKAILNALSENGYADVAYKVASQETFPSWGWWIKNGATTLYENWPIDSKSDISLNHIMFGEIGAWYYKALGGIKPDPGKPGFRNVLVQPYFVAELNQFEVKHRSPYGEIVSSWERKGKKLVYTLIIPPNSSASVTLPVSNKQKLYRNGDAVKTAEGNYREEVAAGTYVYEWK